MFLVADPLHFDALPRRLILCCLSPGSGSGGGNSPFRPDATAGSPITLKWIIPHATDRGEISYFPAGRAVIAAESTQDRRLPANWIPGVAIPPEASRRSPRPPVMGGFYDRGFDRRLHPGFERFEDLLAR